MVEISGNFPVPAGLILSGGLALGAYQLGVAETLLQSPRLDLRAVAGSSIGAINGAILAGNAPDRRREKLASFWHAIATDSGTSAWLDPLGLMDQPIARHLRNWLSAAAARLGGSPALFRPRMALEGHESGVPSLYIAERTRATIEQHVDFNRLNSGELRYCCAATDLETGDCVRFDTAAGDRISVDHLIASGSLLPAFPPVRIAGRLLGDGGFSANAPLEPLLASDRICEAPPLCFLVDLFPVAAQAPRSLEKAAERAADLKYACQTAMRLQGLQRERALEARLAERDAPSGTDLFWLALQGARKRPDRRRCTISPTALWRSAARPARSMRWQPWRACLGNQAVPASGFTKDNGASAMRCAR